MASSVPEWLEEEVLRIEVADTADLAAEAEALRDRIAYLERAIEEAERMPAPRGAAASASAAAPVAGDAAPTLPDNYEVETFDVPPHSVPIRCDVRQFDFPLLSRHVQFDVITMDPPWQLASAAPTRGVALGYDQLHNRDIADIPVPMLQKNGFLFMWIINARYTFALELFKKWGYRLVDDITWVKATVNRRMAKGHGFYLQHAKETCLVGLKGAPPDGTVGNIGSDVIFAPRRGQSQKPEEIYDLVEQLVPNGRYLEIFSRRNNLRNHWVSIGNEL